MEFELTRYDEARKALAICANIDEVKDIQDKSEAMRLYARMSENTELEVYASTIKLRAQVRLGEIIAGMETRIGKLPTAGTLSKTENISAAGISKSTANRYEQLAAIPEPVIDSYIAKNTAVQKPVTLAAIVASTKPKPEKQQKPEPVSEPVTETVTIPKDQYEEMQALIDESMENDKALEKMIDGNMDLTAAVETIKQQTALIAAYKSQLVGKDNKINELIKSVKSKDRQIAKLEKQLKEGDVF